MNDNVRWILSYALNMKKAYFLYFLLALGDLLTGFALTGIQKWLIDDVFINRDFGRLWPLLWIFIGIVIAYNLVHLGNFVVRQRNQFIFREKILDDMIRSFYRMPVARYQNERIGKFMNYLTNDVNNASGMLANFFPNGIISIIRVLILVIIVGIASPIILIATTVLCTAYIAMGKYFGKRFWRMGRQVQDARSEVAVQIEEGVSSTREVVAFHRMDWEEEKYNRSFQHFFQLAMNYGKLKNKELAFLEPFRWMITLMAFGYGGYQVVIGNMTPGTFVVVFQFTSQLVGAYQEMYKFYTSYKNKVVNVERIREFMEAGFAPRGTERVEVEKIQSIQLQNVSFRYSEQTDYVLEQLSLSIPVGKKTAFVGASGGGKSTIAQLLMRFYDPQSGSVLINGEPLDELKEDSWRSKIGIVFQEPYLFPDTIRNNLDMGKGCTEEQMLEACRLAALTEMLDSLPDGLNTEIGERGITLSGGQRQRLALARAILNDPELLILDEATSSLDMETERQVQQHIDQLRQGKTTVIIAHRLSTVENADLIYVMKDGQVAESGTHDELMKRGQWYKELVYAQLKLEAGAS